MVKISRVPLLVFLLLFQSCVAHSESAIASAHPLATQAGISILKQGGNAFDAAIAVSAVLAVVEPYSSGIGGGGFWLLHSAKTNKDIMIDGRERAPLAATQDMYLSKNGDVIEGASIDGPLSAGIPGVPAALDHLAKHYGLLPLAKSLQPAIDIAINGFEVDAIYRKLLSFRLDAILSSSAAADIFLQENEIPDNGYLLQQPDLANTLKRIAEFGASGFYQGDTADKLITSVRESGGIWSQKDLDEYRVIERLPIVGEYKGMRITSVAPPSSGGIALVEMFNMLAQLKYDFSDKVSRVHHVTEVMRRAYRDRAEYLGDSDYVSVPVKQLTSIKHAKKIIEDFSKKSATSSATLRAVNHVESQSVDTTHFSIIDDAGNRVAATLSVNYPFGSGFVAEGTGVLLNDEMDDFSVKPGAPNVYGLVGGQANAIEPGKRMLSSMSPTFLETKDRIAILGTPGGSRIITMVLLAALDFFYDSTAQEMVELPRFHHQYLPDMLFYEPDAFDLALKTALIDKGHVLEENRSTYGNMQVVIQNKKTSEVTAASDNRGIGSSVVLH